MAAATDVVKQERGGYVLLVSVIVAGLFLPRVVTPRQPTQPQTRTGRAAAQPEPIPSVRELDQLLRDHFPEKSGPLLPILVATMPDPVDSQVGWLFDGTLEALERAFEAHGHRLVGFTLPWDSTNPRRPQDTRRLNCPGVLLFASRDQTPHAVLLVGETLGGCHAEALRAALAQALVRRDSKKPIDILGPTFSGSVHKLGVVLRECIPEKDRQSDQPLFRVVTGSATNPENEKKLIGALGGVNPKLVKFNATILPDDLLRIAVRRYLMRSNEEEWRKTALLVESNTDYGQATLPYEQQALKRDKRRAPSTGETASTTKGLIFLPYPMQLSRVRSAYERDRSLRVEEGRTIERPRQFLQLPLDAAEQPSDVLPALSPLMTTANTELAMASLLSNVSRDAVEAVGVQATDPKEVLFLSRLIKDHCPDVRLFTFESYLMFLHEDYQPFLHGMIVASTYPLYARNQHWTQARKEAGEEEVETHLQFRCSLDQGVYNATTALLNDELPPDQRLPLLEYSLPFSPQHRRPPVWLSVVGSGGLWPVEVRGIGESDAPTVLSGQLAASLPRVSHDVMFTLFGLLPMTLFCLAHLGVLYVAIRKESNLDDWWLIKVLQPILGRGHGLAAVSSLFVLLLGLELVLASVAVLPTLVNHRGGRGELSDHLVLALLGVALLVPFMGCAYASSLRFSKNLRWLMGGAALGGLLVWVVVVLACSSLLEGKALATANLVLFYERASSLFSGVSPIIPIVHLGLGAYLMLLGLFHRKGRLFVLDVGEALIRFVRVSPRPLREIGRRASRVLGQRLPWRLESVSLHLVAFAATVALLLFLLCTRALVPSTRWTFECRPFEWIYAICLAGLALWLVVELVRLTSLWHGFIRLLGRLATEPLLGALRRLPDAVSGVMKMQLFARPLEEPELVEGLRQAQAILETRPKAPPPGGKELRAWQRASNRITGLLEQLPHSEHVSERSLLRATMASVPRIHEATVSLRGSKDKAQREWARRGEEFVAAHVVNVLRYWIQQLRNGLVFLTLSSFFLFLSVTSYPFQPQRMLSWVGGVLVLVVLLAAIGVFVRMNRNLVLSTIAGTSPGRITWDRGFIVSILTVVVLPLLALLARIFPSLGGSLESATDSALRLLR